jgi:ATP-dependent exoDNAse (exonuclease V) alpha subunit
MVEKMQERLGNHPGIVHTIHHITTVAKYIEGPAGTEWLAQYEIIVIDEASNVDEKLLADLLSAVPNATKLVMVGDLDQSKNSARN